MTTIKGRHQGHHRDGIRHQGGAIGDGIQGRRHPDVTDHTDLPPDHRHAVTVRHRRVRHTLQSVASQSHLYVMTNQCLLKLVRTPTKRRQRFQAKIMELKTVNEIFNRYVNTADVLNLKTFTYHVEKESFTLKHLYFNCCIVDISCCCEKT